MEMNNMKKLETSNLEHILKTYFKPKNGECDIIIGIDHLSEQNGADIVVYDITDMTGNKPKTYQEFIDRNTDLGDDEEIYEIDRVTLVEIDDDI